MMTYTHLLMGNSSSLPYYEKSHHIEDIINGFDGISLKKDKFPFLQFRTSPKIWILKKK